MISSRKRTVKKSSSSRTAQLEEKLDDLVSILRASQSQPQTQQAKSDESLSQQGRSDTSMGPSSETRSFPSRLDSLATAATSSTTAASAYQYRLPSSQFPPGGTIDPPKPSDQRQNLLQDPPAPEADASLNKFRSWLNYFGYMYLPPEMKAEELRRDKPVLYSVIMQITSMSVIEQHAMSDIIRKDLLNRIFVESERSVDLLLALITFLTWYVPQARRRTAYKNTTDRPQGSF